MARRARSDTPKSDDGNSDGESPDGGNRSVDSGLPDTPTTDPSGPGDSVIDPASIAGNSGDSEPRKRKQRSDRGQPRGSRSEKETKIDLGDFAQILSEIHSGIALFAGIPEIALDESADEHVKLARAIERVKRHYDLPSVSPIALDWFMLLKTFGLVYGSRIIAYNMRMRAENARPINPTPSVTAHAPNSPQQARPTAPPPQQPTPRPPANAPIGIVPAPGVIRAAAIPGFENVTLDINVAGSNKPTH